MSNCITAAERCWARGKELTVWSVRRGYPEADHYNKRAGCNQDICVRRLQPAGLPSPACLSDAVTSVIPSVDPVGIPSTLPRGAVTSRRATALGSGALAVVLVDVGTPVFNFMSANS